ncbi:MAG: HD domain-containing protein [Syntrophales bacterium]|nr:HD domain-containing protein [Syntrophales bacterium]
MTDNLQQSVDASEILIIPGLEEAEGYGPLPLRNLTLKQEVPFDVYLKIKKKGAKGPQFVKGCARGDIYRQDWNQKLLKLKIPCVYVSLAEMGRVMQYIHHQLELVLGDDTLSEVEKGVRVCDATHMWAINFFNREEARTAEEINGALHFLDYLFTVIKDDPHNIWQLLQVKRHKGFRLYTHCLHVCLLGLAFTTYLGWSRKKVLGFGLGALIHDIGLTRTPRAILEKKGALTADEMLEIKRHPIDGGRMVQGFVNLRWEALQMVLQHHENGDGSGYPKGLKSATIHSWARICRVLDSYEAMTAKRPWRAALEPKDALWTMHSDWKRSKVFDPSYLKTFIKFLADT